MGCKLTAEEVAHIDRTIADLQDENARLRSCLSDDAENARMIMAENTKLRELLDYMTPIAWYASSERERDRMRELGIEVKP